MSAPAESLTSEKHPMLLFFDGDCSFCNRWVARLKEADRTHRIRFGTRQGKTFQRLAQAHPELAKIESVVLVKRRTNGGEDFLTRSSAIHEAIKGLPGFWFFERMLRIFPTPISDLGYHLFSKLREPLFSSWADIRFPLEDDKELFVE